MEYIWGVLDAEGWALGAWLYGEMSWALWFDTPGFGTGALERSLFCLVDPSTSNAI